MKRIFSIIVIVVVGCNFAFAQQEQGLTYGNPFETLAGVSQGGYYSENDMKKYKDDYCFGDKTKIYYKKADGTIVNDNFYKRGSETTTYSLWKKDKDDWSEKKPQNSELANYDTKTVIKGCNENVTLYKLKTKEKPAKTKLSEAQQEEQAKNEAQKKIEELEKKNKALTKKNTKNDAKIAELKNEIAEIKKGNSSNAFLYVLIVLLAAALVAILLFLKKKKSNKMDTTVIQHQNTNKPQQQPTVVEPATVTPQQPTPVPQSTPKPIPTEPIVAFAKDADEWIVVGASVIGNGHISMDLPCQDSHKYEYLGEGWGIAISSDGAGSAQNSHIGSKIVAERCVFHFKDLITKRNWIKKNELPTETEWSEISKALLKSVRNDMEAFAKSKNIELKSLYATAIVVIHTPDGILATHIGDGRAGYKNKNGEWKALITPHKGDEANQTIFVPSEFWDIPAYKMSDVLVPESVVVKEKPFAFTLMSDGCESTSWLCNQKDEATGKFFDPNKPYPNFFNPLCDTLQSFRNDKVEEKERAKKWGNFIKEGNKPFEREQDDKTMILGVVYM